MRETKFRLIKDNKIVGYERYIYCDQREGYVKGKSLVPQHSEDSVHWKHIYTWEMRTRPKGYWFEAHLDMDVYIEHDKKEQYTSLKDKNGKEIYEGDIIRLAENTFGQSESPINCVVKWNDKGFYQLWRNGIIHWNFWQEDTYHNKGYRKKWEVIGSIHSNPELLK